MKPNLHLLLMFFAIVFSVNHTLFAETETSQLWATMTSGGLNGNGVIYKVNVDGTNGGPAVIFDGTNGSKPSGNMVEGAGNILYGTTSAGGAYGYGVIFSYNVNTENYAKLFDFNSVDGATPKDLLLVNGKLYGTTQNGGVYSSSTATLGAGVLYSFDPATLQYSKLIDFGSEKMNGENPQGLILADDGKLYGMTRQGGGFAGGIIYSYNPANSVPDKLYDLTEATGTLPSNCKLLQTANNWLYGVATWGGANGTGTIFSFNVHTKSFTQLYDFDSINGAYPSCTLIQGADGKLYGTTLYGGAYNEGGVIFSYDMATGIYTKKHDFYTATGTVPFAGVILGSDNLLYGMTTKGGTNNTGVIYSFNPANNVYTVVSDCDGTTAGGQPNSTVLEIANNATGIKEPARGSLKIYPNPVSDKLLVQTSDFNPQWTTVFDANGQIVIQAKFFEHLDITTLSSGVYFAEFKDANNNTFRTDL